MKKFIGFKSNLVYLRIEIGLGTLYGILSVLLGSVALIIFGDEKIRVLAIVFLLITLAVIMVNLFDDVKPLADNDTLPVEPTEIKENVTQKHSSTFIEAFKEPLMDLPEPTKDIDEVLENVGKKNKSIMDDFYALTNEGDK